MYYPRSSVLHYLFCVSWSSMVPQLTWVDHGLPSPPCNQVTTILALFSSPVVDVISETDEEESRPLSSLRKSRADLPASKPPWKMLDLYQMQRLIFSGDGYQLQLWRSAAYAYQLQLWSSADKAYPQQICSSAEEQVSASDKLICSSLLVSSNL
ncbi:hypothetical protein L1987_43585 [Smallanthus sonchifolius]|uniref:Uncharacterized protein n=1 Tax=Smallanthus sonchifolius TaxID=185202 RepID=A0ACB9GN18_9ASTR|nr:hypothetical protein L1987_43585 [Smallanthus sonchifolius]